MAEIERQAAGGCLAVTLSECGREAEYAWGVDMVGHCDPFRRYVARRSVCAGGCPDGHCTVGKTLRRMTLGPDWLSPCRTCTTGRTCRPWSQSRTCRSVCSCRDCICSSRSLQFSIHSVCRAHEIGYRPDRYLNVAAEITQADPRMEAKFRERSMSAGQGPCR